MSIRGSLQSGEEHTLRSQKAPHTSPLCGRAVCCLVWIICRYWLRYNVITLYNPVESWRWIGTKYYISAPIVTRSPAKLQRESVCQPWTHKGHPISPWTCGQAMWCLLWVFCRNSPCCNETALYNPAGDTLAPTMFLCSVTPWDLIHFHTRSSSQHAHIRIPGPARNEYHWIRRVHCIAKYEFADLKRVPRLHITARILRWKAICLSLISLNWNWYFQCCGPYPCPPKRRHSLS